ncbi:histidine phosphatase family protein [Nocardioides albidus]|uniref:Histidine phosphatase family protein n=1 Tax=Nocardioides albidus TaxID=1517589 RepID=A0A5C4VV06_9ACTN|nr:histidine phosphatase family protein [Nocardioides albidus]TNM39657.1 histidine phosphatase family protein [Nocardioides albidus]
MEKQRLLVVVRHAKAEAFAPSDADRVLTAGGRGDGQALGAWLAAEGIAPDVAYVSYAARARETWEAVSRGAGWGLAPQIDGNLYATDEEGVLEIVRTTAEDASTVVVVGHNPTMAMLTQLLDDGDGEATDSVELGTFPTGAAAVFEVDATWEDLAPMGCRLRAFHVGRA